MIIVTKHHQTYTMTNIYISPALHVCAWFISRDLSKYRKDYEYAFSWKHKAMVSLIEVRMFVCNDEIKQVVHQTPFFVG